MVRIARAAAGLPGTLRRFDGGRLDSAVALAMTAVTEVQVWHDRVVQDRQMAAVAGLVMCGCVAVRRRWPLVALVVGVGAVAVETFFGGVLAQDAVAAIPAAVLLFYSAGACLPAARARWALLAGLAVLAVQVLRTPDMLSDLFFEPALLAIVPWAGGRAVRANRRRELLARQYAEELDDGLELVAPLAGEQERVRIARELHDAVGHHLSVMVLQAGGARLMLTTEPDRADAAMRVVQRSGHEALAELGRLLTVLAPGDTATLSPQPGIADLPSLVARSRDAGLDAYLRTDGSARPLSPALELCVYRIVQEALTNILKHAGRVRARVSLEWTTTGLDLQVDDNGTRREPPRRDGHGLIGMRERAATHGVTLSVGPAGNGGWAVLAHLPMTVDEPTRS